MEVGSRLHELTIEISDGDRQFIPIVFNLVEKFGDMARTVCILQPLALDDVWVQCELFGKHCCNKAPTAFWVKRHILAEYQDTRAFSNSFNQGAKEPSIGIKLDLSWRI